MYIFTLFFKKFSQKKSDAASAARPRWSRHLHGESMGRLDSFFRKLCCMLKQYCYFKNLNLNIKIINTLNVI